MMENESCSQLSSRGAAEVRRRSLGSGYCGCPLVVLKAYFADDERVLMDANARVLIVDDDIAVSSATSRLLERAGFRVAVQDSGFGVVMAVRSWRPHLLLLDVGMPGLGGAGVQRVLSTFVDRGVAQIPVVFWSGLPEAELVALAENAKVFAISKRTRPDELVRRLRVIVDDAETSRFAAGGM